MRRFELWRGRCPGCSKPFLISPSLAGKIVRCFQCRLSFEIPNDAPDSTPDNLSEHIIQCLHCGESHYTRMSTCPGCGQYGESAGFQTKIDVSTNIPVSDSQCLANVRILASQSPEKLRNSAGELLASRHCDTKISSRKTHPPTVGIRSWLARCCMWVVKSILNSLR